MNASFHQEARVAALLLSGVTRSQIRYFGRKHYLEHEQRDGWKGELPFYLFWCDACEHFSKDYPHGHTERQYLLCSYCGTHHSFIPLRERIASALGMLAFVPVALLLTLARRFTRIEKHRN